MPLPLLAYIDDFVASLRSHDFGSMFEVLGIIRSFGFLVNEDKCKLELLQRMEALEFVVDTTTMTFWLLELSALLRSPVCQWRFVSTQTCFLSKSQKWDSKMSQHTEVVLASRRPHEKTRRARQFKAPRSSHG